jgi:hypothetical protein
MLSADLADAAWAVGRSLFTRLADKTRSTRVDDRRMIVDAIRSCGRPAPWCRCVRSDGLPRAMFARAGECVSSM